VFKSGVDVRKVLFIIEDTRWVTVHPTDETDLGKLEDLLIIKSPTFMNRLMESKIGKQIEQ
jgi:hypothetical protein